MRESEAAYIVGLLGAAWSKQLSRETIGIYAQEIAGEDYEVAVAAARSLIRTREFFPAVSVLLDAIQREKRDRSPGFVALPAGDDSVSLDELPDEQRQAWAAMRELLSRWGA